MLNDPLAEVVTLLDPTAGFSKLVEGSGVWRTHREGTGEPFYCALLDGRCRMIVDEQPAITLEKWDYVLLPTMGDLIFESLDSSPETHVILPVEVSPGHFRVGNESQSPNVRMQVGHCSFGSPDAALLASLMPQIVITRGEPRLVLLMQLIGEETRARRSGRDLILQRLLEVMLIEAMRCGSDTTSSPGLARGLADERIAIALRAIHARPEHPWTVVKLAGNVALSRSAFFARFSRVVGVAPMEYLLTWRMALARRMLKSQEFSVDQVAERVGYSSASTFTVAFTRHLGMPPARFARTQQDGMQQARAAGQQDRRDPSVAS